VSPKESIEELASILSMADFAAARVVAQIAKEAESTNANSRDQAVAAFRRVAALNRALDVLRGRTETNVRADERERIARWLEQRDSAWAIADIIGAIRNNLQLPWTKP